MDKRKSVLELVMLGKTTKEISKQLMMTISSVRYYREPSKSDRARQISDHRRKIKRKAVDYSGGKCLRCGYNKCYAALVFHHLDPNEKEHGLALGNTWGWRKIKKEVDKCILICIIVMLNTIMEFGNQVYQ